MSSYCAYFTPNCTELNGASICPKRFRICLVDIFLRNFLLQSAKICCNLLCPVFGVCCGKSPACVFYWRFFNIFSTSARWLLRALS